jgi:hypothetical protein
MQKNKDNTLFTDLELQEAANVNGGSLFRGYIYQTLARGAMNAGSGWFYRNIHKAVNARNPRAVHYVANKRVRGILNTLRFLS